MACTVKLLLKHCSLLSSFVARSGSPNYIGANPSSMASLSECSEVAVGRRCYCEGFYGTVRFVGEVPPSKGKEEHTFLVQGSLYISSSLSLPSRKECGWGWSGMTPHAGNTTGSVKECGTSHAGTPHSLLQLISFIVMAYFLLQSTPKWFIRTAS